jgi:hypothetical protein
MRVGEGIFCVIMHAPKAGIEFCRNTDNIRNVRAGKS